MDLEENLNISNSWIPVKALRTAADIKETLKKKYDRKVSSSPSSTPNKISVSVEVKANSPTSNTIHFSSLHSRYNTASLDIVPIYSEMPESTEKKYINNISRLNEEILIMSSQLKQANETIASLTQKINENNSKHVLHLQSLHERHEQKLRRNKQDMDNLLKDAYVNSSSLALEKIILEKNLELELQKRKFQEKIEDITKRFEAQLENQDAQHKHQVDALKDQFLDIVINLKERFLVQITSLQTQYKQEIDRTKSAIKVISFDYTMDEVYEEKYKLNDSDLQIIEEISSQPNIIIKKPFRESGCSDLDLSLRQLINQITLEHEGSISDL
jgi:hypothetical protein